MCTVFEVIIEYLISIATTSKTGIKHISCSELKKSWILETWWLLFKFFLTKKIVV